MRKKTTINRFDKCLPAVPLALALVLGVPTAGAHALLVKFELFDQTMASSSPTKVAARYSQELDTRLSSMRVFDLQGRQVDNGDGRVDLTDPDHAWLVATLPAALPAGTYTVRWNVVSAEDGDPTEGEFRFRTGAASSDVSHHSDADVHHTWATAGIVLGLGTVWLLHKRRRRQRYPTLS